MPSPRPPAHGSARTRLAGIAVALTGAVACTLVVALLPSDDPAGAVAAPVPSSVPPSAPSSMPASMPTLLVSADSDRSDPLPLAGATVRGRVYVFANAPGVRHVEFHIDDTRAEGRPDQLERTPPYDLMGGSRREGDAFDTRDLAKGQHTITMVLTSESGIESTVTSTFEIDNTGRLDELIVPAPSAVPTPPVTTPPVTTPPVTTPPVTTPPVTTPPVMTPTPADPTPTVPTPTDPAPEPTPTAPEPTPTAPKPAPTAPKPNPNPKPPSGALWPGPSNTGVPAGTVLKRSGSIVVVEDGAVIDARDVDGCITVAADDVRISRTRVRCAGPHAIRLVDDASGLLVEDTEIDGSRGQVSAAICCSDYTLRRVDIHGVIDGPRLGDASVVEDSWIHHLKRVPGSHNDTLQTQGGTGIVVSGNRLDAYNPVTDDPMNSTIQTGSLRKPLRNMRFEGNLLNGGNFTVHAGEGGEHPISGYVFRHNRFGRDFRYGPVTALGGASFDSSNVWHDTGLPVR